MGLRRRESKFSRRGRMKSPKKFEGADIGGLAADAVANLVTDEMVRVEVGAVLQQTAKVDVISASICATLKEMDTERLKAIADAAADVLRKRAKSRSVFVRMFRRA